MTFYGGTGLLQADERSRPGCKRADPRSRRRVVRYSKLPTHGSPGSCVANLSWLRVPAAHPRYGDMKFLQMYPFLKLLQIYPSRPWVCSAMTPCICGCTSPVAALWFRREAAHRIVLNNSRLLAKQSDAGAPLTCACSRQFRLPQIIVGRVLARSTWITPYRKPRRRRPSLDWVGVGWKMGTCAHLVAALLQVGCAVEEMTT